VWTCWWVGFVCCNSSDRKRTNDCEHLNNVYNKNTPDNGQCPALYLYKSTTVTIWIQLSDTEFLKPWCTLSVTHTGTVSVENWYICYSATTRTGPGQPTYRSFTITLRHTRLDRTPVHEGSAHRRDLYLTTHNTHKRCTSTPQRDSNPQSQ